MSENLIINVTAPNLVNICIDGHDSSEILGRFYTKHTSKPTAFSGTTSLFKNLEMYFDEIGFPQASTKMRSFSKQNAFSANNTRKVQPEMSKNDITTQKGEKGTFVVNVQYRQNSTWQGNVVWAEKNVTQNFRSALELLKLIDSALSDSGAE